MLSHGAIEDCVKYFLIVEHTKDMFSSGSSNVNQLYFVVLGCENEARAKVI